MFDPILFLVVFPIIAGVVLFAIIVACVLVIRALVRH